MDFQLASDAYTMAQRRGQKEYKEYELISEVLFALIIKEFKQYSTRTCIRSLEMPNRRSD